MLGVFGTPSTNLGLGGLLNGAIKPGYEQNGPIYNGPGSRHQSAAFTHRQLNSNQKEAIDRAKKYAVDENVKITLAKTTIHQAQPLTQNPINKRAQTVALLSRVYIGSIAYGVREDNLNAAFSPFGPIRAVNLSWDPVTEKHKGFAFIEFELPESALLACEQMNGMHFNGRNLRVGRPSNLPEADQLIADLIKECNLSKKIYISSVHPGLTDDDLALVFEAFGKISSCKAINPPEDASTPTISIPTAAAVAAASATAKVMAIESENVGKGKSDLELNSMTASGTDNSNGAGQSKFAIESNAPTGQTSFDDDDDGGSLERQENLLIKGFGARSAMMQKLSRPPPRGIMILRNMVGPDDCDDSLESEVAEESSNFGPVEKVIIYQELDESNAIVIKVFVVFTEAESVDKAIASLNGRFFAGRQICAERYDLDLFESNDLSG